ncbi:MAG: hypothetical protein ACRC7N_20865 [Clostridium sp.]
MANKKVKTVKKENPLNPKKTDYDIPKFTIKSAFVILGFGVLGTYIFPMILSALGASTEMGVVIGNALITPFGIAVSRCFVETKQGFGKKFCMIYGGFALAFGFISAYWMYKGIYI